MLTAALDWSEIKLGTLAGWIAAIGTAGALVLLTVGLLQERKRRRGDEEANAEERRNAEKRHARLVTTLIRSVGKERIDIAVANDGTGPTFQIDLRLLHADSKPGSTPTVELPTTVATRPEVLARVLSRDEILVSLTPAFPVVENQWVATVVTFTDVNGLRWKRVDNQEPTRVYG